MLEIILTVQKDIPVAKIRTFSSFDKVLEQRFDLRYFKHRRHKFDAKSKIVKCLFYTKVKTDNILNSLLVIFFIQCLYCMTLIIKLQ